MNMNHLLFSIGHSNQNLEEFNELLESQNIDCILDVRSVPYSKYTQQFNEESLKNWLNKQGILYVPFGKHFGARRYDCLKDTEFVKKGLKEIKPQVNFELGIATPEFIKGVERLEKVMNQGRRVAIMCSEANPLECHRFSFISRYFHDNGWNVQHIIRDNETGKATIRSHHDLEIEMIMDYVKHNKLKSISGQISDTLSFDFEDDYDEKKQRVDAYRLKNKEIGWIPSNDNQENE